MAVVMVIIVIVAAVIVTVVVIVMATVILARCQYKKLRLVESPLKKTQLERQQSRPTIKIQRGEMIVDN
ncbi:hypothetical protein KIN20_017120 [Parelaphostrongylus tenuis]|uniref:Uncharacterized protein n=1 Tax=Parelaphostrongylus tenuis TaxID=148309 RepID=A0AAD5N0G6_PARTN|nr:hypothetical protein KIN20_017120 [Parelaphostrongylus tenuis]